MDQIVIQANFVPNCGTIDLAILIPLSPSKGDTLLLNLPYVNLSLWYSLWNHFLHFTNSPLKPLTLL